jgi:hypothetical protein
MLQAKLYSDGVRIITSGRCSYQCMIKSGIVVVGDRNRSRRADSTGFLVLPIVLVASS